MPDYCSSGIWNADGKDESYELDPTDDLKLPDELVKRLDKWIEVYDEATFGGKEAWEGGADIDNKKFDFVNSESIFIAQEIKNLHPDWIVELWLETHCDGKLDGMVKMTMTEIFKYKTTYA